MYAVTGITGQVGGHVARTLLRAGRSLSGRRPRLAERFRMGRPGVRRGGRGHGRRGTALAEAFRGTRGPSYYSRRPSTRPRASPRRGQSLQPYDPRSNRDGRNGWSAFRPSARSWEENLLTQLTLLERALSDAPCRSLSFVQHGSSKTAVGMLPRRRTAVSSRASCTRSTGRYRWSRWRTWGASRQNFCRRRGLGGGSWNSKALSGCARTISRPHSPTCSAVTSGPRSCRETRGPRLSRPRE